MLVDRTMRNMLLNPGQKVRVVRTVSIAYDLDISEYLDGDGKLDGEPVTVSLLESDIEDYQDVMAVLDEQSNLEVTDIKVEITEIH